MTYVYMAERLDETKFMALMASWDAPDPTAVRAPVTPVAAEAEGAAFMSFMGAQNALQRETTRR